MVQNQEQPVGKITFSILIALSLSHCLNDLYSPLFPAAYPLFKDDLDFLPGNRPYHTGLSTFGFGFSTDYGNHL